MVRQIVVINGDVQTIPTVGRNFILRVGTAKFPNVSIMTETQSQPLNIIQKSGSQVLQKAFISHALVYQLVNGRVIKRNIVLSNEELFFASTPTNFPLPVVDPSKIK
ncbi:hypothetical protein IC620_00065 [Hazenella sp. IB182357]|uniref:Uncharacterized protein n=1 Tax=Polycladospora coralii TaxID=2771432 RepID=A0A926RT60_9BACL|nr:hypothetical protein [Polycladospora coralii]MBD1370754.1 hypothetical protein [Polycladospora coralii]MBS7529692.1 hypothetical protein [Polycladospora coralii]